MPWNNQAFLSAAAPNSRAHPALPSSQATPQGLAPQTSPRTNPFIQNMASKPPTSQPNGSLPSNLNNTISTGQPNNWLRPSVQQILMQQAMLQQQGGMPPRQLQQQPSPLTRPGNIRLLTQSHSERESLGSHHSENLLCSVHWKMMFAASVLPWQCLGKRLGPLSQVRYVEEGSMGQFILSLPSSCRFADQAFNPQAGSEQSPDADFAIIQYD